MSGFVSVFDMLKIGVGPSSSHTLGPWLAAQKWIQKLQKDGLFGSIDRVKIDLYGSLSLTGKGHATDLAVLLGLTGIDYESFPVENIDKVINQIKSTEKIHLDSQRFIQFYYRDIVFNKNFLPFHANGLTFSGFSDEKIVSTQTYYSIGGGFVIQEEESNLGNNTSFKKKLPFPIDRASSLESFCNQRKSPISDIVHQNELTFKTIDEIDTGLKRIWDTMLSSMYIGCHTEGVLPGGLGVKRRAFQTHKKLIKEQSYKDPQQWIVAIRKTEVKFRDILKWVSCFALSVNEVNASLGRVVTAPTNGSAGVIPAVLMYYLTIENHKAGFEQIKKFLLVAGEVGSIFKKNATISAAMGGCQAEIGVSASMAAAGLTELLEGSPSQCLEAAEIAMEHHLGLTCDPIAGLVQVPCIERNSMGAIKAIHAAELALERNPKESKVSLDQVVDTMWQTAKAMDRNYKETSKGGLAVSVGLADC